MEYYKVIQGEWGAVIRVFGKFSKQAKKALEQLEVKGLQLSYSESPFSDDPIYSQLNKYAMPSWTPEPLNFLKELDLDYLRILNLNSVANLSVIEELEGLRFLFIGEKLSMPINYRLFDRLEKLSCFWHKGDESIGECFHLKNLEITGYNKKNLQLFQNLESLEELILVKSRLQSLQGLNPSIESLEFHGCHGLVDLKSLEECKKLNYLKFEGASKITSESLLSLPDSVEHLELNGIKEIETLKTLSHLKNLKSIRFFESTNILDCDISVLEGLPKLESAMFNIKRHYKLNRDKAIYSGI